MPSITCLLCGQKLEMRVSKKEKPYFVCNLCGVQFFVRREQGIKRLNDLMRNAEEAGMAFQQRSRNLYEMQAILQEIDGVRMEIKKNQSLFANKEQARARKLLKTRLANLFEQLEELATKKT